MDTKTIEKFFNFYKNGIGGIRSIENKLLKCSYSFEQWSDALKSKSEMIRHIYDENEKHMRDFLGLKEENLTPEVADMMITHVDFFISEGYRDYNVTASALNLLIGYYKNHEPLYRLFDCYYFMGVTLMEVNEYEKSCEYFRRALELYSDTTKCKEDYRLFRIMASYYYRLVAAVCDKNASPRTVIEYYESALSIWVDHPLVNFVTEKKKQGIESMFSMLVCMYVEKYIEKETEPEQWFKDIVEREFLAQADKTGSLYGVDNRIFVVYYKLRKKSGAITKGEYNIQICRKYEYEKALQQKFTYYTKNFLQLYDDETKDEDFDVNDVSYMNRSYTYIDALIPEMINIFRKNDYIDELMTYYSEFPVLTRNYIIDYLIENNIKKIFIYTKDEETVINLLEKIFMNRQIVTLIHENMVSRLAGLITGYIIDEAPSMFVGTFGITSESGVNVNRDRILHYARNAGLIHDIGKIMCTDIVNLQFRKLCDLEFDIVKKHSERGNEMIKYIPALAEYNDVVLGHHKDYNGKGGYPQGFDNTKSEYRIFIDIIKLCDCIDAATDGLGRNYARTKQFKDVLAEFEFDKGTKYSDRLVNFISGNEKLKKEIERLTGIERQHVYYDIYYNMVKPVIKYSKKDETFIRKYTSSDEESVAAITGRTGEEQHDIACTCENNLYILTNGNNDVIGNIVLREKGDTLDIVELFIKKELRRFGNGSKLLGEIEKMAADEGFAKITIPEGDNWHSLVFCYRRGYSKSAVQGVMEKIL